MDTGEGTKAKNVQVTETSVVEDTSQHKTKPQEEELDNEDLIDIQLEWNAGLFWI